MNRIIERCKTFSGNLGKHMQWNAPGRKSKAGESDCDPIASQKLRLQIMCNNLRSVSSRALSNTTCLESSLQASKTQKCKLFCFRNGIDLMIYWWDIFLICKSTCFPMFWLLGSRHNSPIPTLHVIVTPRHSTLIMISRHATSTSHLGGRTVVVWHPPSHSGPCHTLNRFE